MPATKPHGEWLPFSEIHKHVKSDGVPRTLYFASPMDAYAYGGWNCRVLTVTDYFRIDHYGDQVFHADWVLNGETIYSYSEDHDDPTFCDEGDFYAAMDGSLFIPIEEPPTIDTDKAFAEIEAGLNIVFVGIKTLDYDTIAEVRDDGVLTERGREIGFIPIPWERMVRLPRGYLSAETRLPLMSLDAETQRSMDDYMRKEYP